MQKTGRERLADYRWRIKLKQNALADLLGITDSYLSQILSGRRRPGLDIAARIEEHTGIPASAWSATAVAKMAKRRTRVTSKPSVVNELSDASHS